MALGRGRHMAPGARHSIAQLQGNECLSRYDVFHK